jgi:DNA end-binding protein Ku
VCTADDEEVPWSDIIKGYEYAKGKYVTLSDDELKAAALESSRSIQMLDFTEERAIDPRFFETPYYLLPEKGGEKAYALLREAMRTTGMVGIGKFTLRQKQQLASVKAVGDALVLEVMRFASQLIDVSDFTFPPASDVRPQELKMAEQLIGNLAGTFDPSKYTDDYHINLMRIIRAKLKGKKIEPEESEARDTTQVLDLMTRLQESLAQGKAGASGGANSRPKRSAATKARTPARSSRARKSA